MSSICGIFRRDGGPVGERDISRQVESLDHCLSAATGVWVKERVGLGHVLRHNTPESVGERQPAEDSAGHLFLTADARIDNRDDLSAALEVSASAPDSAFILAAYRKWGESCPEHLLGDFAFAIWDSERQKLFCARDHFGLKPFYYFADDRTFVFGSEIKAIFATGDGPARETDSLGIGLELCTFTFDRERTLFRDIKRLPPASCCVVDRNGIRFRTFWTPDPNKEVRFRRIEDYAEAFREIFDTAVRCRLRSPGKAVSLLSGGLDSSAIAGFAARRESIPCLSWVLPEGDPWPIPDERRFIEPFREMWPDLSYTYIDQTRRTLFEGDEAIRDWNEGYNPEIRSFATIPTFEAVRDAGANVLLSGDGGDHTASYGCYDYNAQLLIQGRWYRLARELLSEAKLRGKSVRSLIRRRLLNPLKCAHFQAYDAQKRGIHAIPLRQEFIDDSVLADYMESFLLDDLVVPGERARTSMIRHIAAAPFHKIGSTLMRSSELYGVETRFPFMDLRVAEFCMAVPPEAHCRDGIRRRLLRDATAGVMPEKIRWRPGKTDTLPAIQRRVAGEAGKMRAMLREWNSDSRIPTVLDLPAIDNGIRTFEEMDFNARIPWVEPHSGKIIAALMMGRFLEEFT